MARTILDIANEALGDLPADQITSLDDASSMSARHCKRLYGGIVSDLAERHNWDFLIKREALAVTANTRGEWGYAYALPGDVRSPIGILPTITGAFNGGMIGFQGIDQQYRSRIQYEISGSLLYTSLPSAVLEYVAEPDNPAIFTALFARAVATELAARLVMPLINDAKRQADLVKIAEAAMARAVADDINRNASRDLDFVSERAMSRGVGSYPVWPI